MKTISDLRSKLIGKILISLFLSLTSMTILINIFGQYFMTIDDARLLYVYAGYASGNPTGVYLFSNSVFGWILSTLYTLIPTLNWYHIYHLFVILFFLTVLGIAIHQVFNRISTISIFIHLITIILCFSNTILLMHFEQAATLTGCSGLILLIIHKHTYSIRSQMSLLVGIAILFIASYLQEKNAFYVIACFALLITFYKIIKLQSDKTDQTKKATVNLVALIIGVFLCVLVLSALQTASRVGIYWEEYAEYNPYRISYWDYDHTEFDDDPELFLNAGWSKEFSTLVDEMFFLDERFSAEGLSHIVDKFDRTSTTRSGSFLYLTLSTLRQVFRTEPKTLTDAFYIISVLVFFSLIIAHYRPEIKSILPDLLCISFALAGMGLLLIYLAWRGRLPLRAFHAVVFPALVTVLFVSLKATMQISNLGSNKISTTFKVIATMIVVLLMSLNVYQVIQTFQADQNSLSYRSRVSAQVKDIEAYVLENQDNLYVFDLFGAQNYDPRTHYPNNDLRNLLVWGSSYIYTPTYYEQIHQFGLKEVTAKTFTKDNVYLVTSKLNDRCRNKFLAYIKSDFDYPALKIVDEIGDSFYVCEVITLPDERFLEVEFNLLGKSYNLKDGEFSFLGQKYRLKDGQIDVSSEDIYQEHHIEIKQSGDDTYLLDSYGTVMTK